MAEVAADCTTDKAERRPDTGNDRPCCGTHRAAGDFDILAFNLSAELTYTNLLNMVDLAGCPVRSADRAPVDLLVGAGGHCTYNPEPIAEFLDFVVLGDGEEVVGEITAAVAAWKQAGKPDRREILRTLAGIDGVYVPALYDAVYDARIATRFHGEGEAATVVGKHCESGDVLVRAASLPEPVPGDVLVTPATGAYGHALANNYNGVPRPPIVFCSGGDARVVVRRETYEDLGARDV